uniref:RING-type E3 ubiquitin transferase (cysteine targeting) n=1 Tax=Macrostomum lignano TaxID=282301 RepID=A0A1I8HQY8_9PLAT
AATEPATVQALRVSQLEADDLDEDMTALLADRILDALSLVQPLVSDWSVELRSAVRFLLCGAMLCGTSGPAATFGAKLYGLELLTAGAAGGYATRLKFLTALCLVGYWRDWLRLRQANARGSSSGAASVSLVSALFGALSLLELANLLAFMRHGRRVSLVHRLLGARWGHPPGPPRLYQPAAFAFVDRELVWHSFAELADAAAGAIADARRFISGRRGYDCDGSSGAASGSPGGCRLCGQEACLPTLCSSDCRCGPCCYFCLAASLPYSCPTCPAAARTVADLVLACGPSE